MCKGKTKAKPEKVKKVRQEKQEVTDNEEDSSDNDLSIGRVVERVAAARTACRTPW